MTRTTLALCASLIGFVPLAHADDTSSASGAVLKAKFEQQAQQACNDALDHDRFGNYSTMEECVSDTANKMMRSYRAAGATRQSTAEARPAQPN